MCTIFKNFLYAEIITASGRRLPQPVHGEQKETEKKDKKGMCTV